MYFVWKTFEVPRLGTFVFKKSSEKKDIYACIRD